MGVVTEVKARRAVVVRAESAFRFWLCVWSVDGSGEAVGVVVAVCEEFVED